MIYFRSRLRALLFSILLAVSAAASDMSAWSHYLEVTIDSTKIDSDLTDYTYAFDFSEIGSGHDFWTTVDSTGKDVRWTKDDGTTELAFELVEIDTTAKTGEAHFNLAGTSSSSTDPVVRLYYGNAGASLYAVDATYGAENAWDSSFVGVWHLAEDANTTAGGYADSTNNDNDGTGVSMSADAAGKLPSKAQDFVPYSDYITVDDDATLDPTAAITISAWVYPDTNPNPNGYIVDHQNQFSLLIDNSGTRGRFLLKSASIFLDINTGATTIGTSTWGHLVGRYDKDAGSPQGSLWLNGSSEATATATTAIGTTTRKVRFGMYTNNDGAPSNTWDFPGLIDEVRISNIARSDAWVKLDYETQNAPSGVYTIGAHTANAAAASFLPRIIIWQ